MMPRRVLSSRHPIVQHLVRLREERSYRQEHSSCLVPGLIPLQELPPTATLLRLVVREGTPYPTDLRANELWEVSEAVMKRITGLVHPQGVAAEVSLPLAASFANEPYLIALDGIADPGNCGTLLRSALALGWEGAFLLEGSVDPFNDKALRAARGATFYLPLQPTTHTALHTWIETHPRQVLVADVSGVSLQECHIQPPVLLIVGSEAHGSAFRSHPRATPITIPMTPHAESLNVGVAGGILMYNLRQHGIR